MPFSVALPPGRFSLAGEGIIVRDASASDVEVWTRTWEPRLRKDGRRTADANWDWATQIARAASTGGFVCRAAVSEASNRLEGLLSLSIAASRLVPGAEIVYIEYVGAAPWNQAELVSQPTIRGVGSLLVKYAQFASREAGCDGRVGLHAKPEVEEFYRSPRFGLVEVGPESTEDGTWVYFETTSNVARS